MKLHPTLFTVASTIALASASCTRTGYMHLSFYGYPDNSPPSGDTAYNCGGRNNVAGGTGTYTDPDGGPDQQACEATLIPNHTTAIIRRPDSTYPIDITPFYEIESTTVPTSSPSPPPGLETVLNTGSSPNTGSGGSANSGGLGSRNNFTINLTVNVNINMNGKRGGRRRRGEWIRGRSAGSCSGNLYPDNDATKICTT